MARLIIGFLFASLLYVVPGASLSGQEPIDFNRDVRPILSENCFFCHGQDSQQRQAGLRLDQRESAIDLGVIEPGDPASSSLIERILSNDADMLMPPADSHRSLSVQQKAILKKWIGQGAEYETHWAFVAPQRPEPPIVDNDRAVRNPIDRFVLAQLESRGMDFSPEADRETLIRRLAIDLTGLPPAPEQIDAFVADPDPRAYEKLVDRFLASPHYGERLSLPWLDAARYSDSNGFQQDGDTWQWIWRDWVVRALNEDLPFDQFTIWQLAGDLLPAATNDQKIASGFNRNHMLNGEGGAIAEEQRFVNLFDRVDTTSTNWLGLTVACAQCHDHKYDPVTQKQYYQLLDLFNRVPESGVPQRQSMRIRVASPFLELPTPENQARITELEAAIEKQKPQVQLASDAAFAGWRSGILADSSGADLAGIPDELKSLLSLDAGVLTQEQKDRLTTLLRNHFNKQVLPGLRAQIPVLQEFEKSRRQLADYRGDQIPRVMIMSDAKPRQTHVLSRGEYLQPGEPVEFDVPDFLPALDPELPKNRLGFAKWLMSSEHPLTARVQVNRMWQYFFGTGIVQSTEDLGVQSEYPAHKELLDWLAVEFRENGWSMKAMHRLIVTSATYRQSSRVTETHLQKDPDNRLFGRATRFRMPAMILRDWALASSGLLVDDIGGKPVYPYQPDNVWEPLAITKERDFTYPASAGQDLYRRSLYTFWRRTVAPANMFDSSNRQACRVRRSETSTPLHALTTLNDPTWVEAAAELARICQQQSPHLRERLTLAFRRVAGRHPTQSQIEILERAFQKQLEHYRDQPEMASELLSGRTESVASSEDEARLAALTITCLTILNMDQSLTRE